MYHCHLHTTHHRRPFTAVTLPLATTQAMWKLLMEKVARGRGLVGVGRWVPGASRLPYANYEEPGERLQEPRKSEKHLLTPFLHQPVSLELKLH